MEVRSAEIPVEGLTQPLKALLVADTQSLSLHWSEKRLAEVLKPLAEAQKPDVIFLLGDYSGISHGPAQKLYNDWMRVDPEAASRILGGLKAPMGVYAILGNHDWAENGYAVAAALREGGATVLDNAHVAVRTPAGDRLTIAGVDDPIGPRGARPDLALRGAPTDRPLIFLTHRPDEAMRLPRPASLALAGHTHGGQIRLPFLGHLVSMSRHGFVGGLYATPKGPLFVSKGVGTAALPFRFFNPPELILLTLTPAGAPNAPEAPRPAPSAPRESAPLVAQEQGDPLARPASSPFSIRLAPHPPEAIAR